jgi:hypothetical protein
MSTYHEQVTATAVSKSALEVVLNPRDLDIRPRRVLTFSAAGGSGKLGLANAAIELGPTADGPWAAETLTGLGITDLAAGASAVYRMDRADRWLRVRAQGAAGAGQTDLTVYLDALGD